MANQSPDDYGWRPMSATSAARLFGSVQAPWWIAGGVALDLFLGRRTRKHGDLDVGLLRRDGSELLEAISEWEIFAAVDGTLLPLPTGQAPGAHVNNLWCRPGPASPWSLELMLDDARADTWLFRRAPQICRPLSEIVRLSPEGIPYLAPEVQLLYKAKFPRERDAADFAVTVPCLDSGARAWLLRALMDVHPGHDWIDALRQAHL